MNKLHKHATLIKLWADGAEIDYLRHFTHEWLVTPHNCPVWDKNTEYRVHPAPITGYIVLPSGVAVQNEACALYVTEKEAIAVAAAYEFACDIIKMVQADE